jgi:hypothetical protein
LSERKELLAKNGEAVRERDFQERKLEVNYILEGKGRYFGVIMKEKIYRRPGFFHVVGFVFVPLSSNLPLCSLSYSYFALCRCGRGREIMSGEGPQAT